MKKMVERAAIDFLIGQIRKGRSAPSDPLRKTYLNIFNTGVFIDVEKLKPQAAELLIQALNKIKKYL